jgi:Flp pilus assembly protein TadD
MDPETIEDVLSLIRERPSDAELFQLLGRLYLRAWRLEEARAAYEQSLALDPGDPFTHLYLGNWFWANGQHQEALKQFKRAARLLPNEAVVYWCQGDVYRALGCDRAAEAAYKKAFRVDPDDPQARRKLSDWYELRRGKGRREAKGKGDD